MPIASISSTIQALRQAALEEVNRNRPQPGARGDPNPSLDPARRVGRSGDALAELKEVDYVAQEDELRLALHGTGPEFGGVLPQAEQPGREPIPTTEEVPPGSDPNLSLTRELLSRVVGNPDLKFLRGHSPHLSTFVSARVLRDLRGGISDASASIKGALECAANQGVASLMEEAIMLLAPDTRPGAQQPGISIRQIVTFTTPRLSGQSAVTGVIISGEEWQVFDFGDTIPAVTNDPINEHYGKAQTDKNKCLLLYLAAASLGQRNKDNFCASYSNVRLGALNDLISQLRWEQHQKAVICAAALGDPTHSDPLVVSELRSHAHDVIAVNHDRDHRTLLCFPVSCLDWANVCIIRISQSCRFSIHLINALSPSEIWFYLVSYQEHMRVASPPSKASAGMIRSSPKTITAPSGWESLLSFRSPSVSIDSRNLPRCPRCQAPNTRLPLGVDGALVGRAMIMTDPQLRSFNISKHWTKTAAQEHSVEAAAACELEQPTPQMDQMPALPPGAAEALDTLFQTIPAEETEFSYPLWNTAAETTDKFIAKSGDLFLAAHAFTCSWRYKRNPTTLTLAGLSVFERLVDVDLYNNAHNVATYGALACGDRPPGRFHRRSYANIDDNPGATAAELWEDVAKGRLMIFAEKSEPYTGNLMGSKLAYVLQKDATNPDTVKTRYIRDPRNEVNDRLANGRHPQCIIPRHQNVARRVLYWKRRYPTIPILISKRDAKGAFKLVPVSVRGLAYMGRRFAHFVAMYLAMFFGWRCSPANWGILSSLLMQYVAAFRPSNQVVEGPESFIAFQYVDDGAFAEPWVGLRPWQSVSL